MSAPTEERAGSLHRFSRGERAVHWTVAVLMRVSILTAAVLYNGSLALLVGHRHVVEVVHVYAGYALAVPILLGLALPAYRADLTRLNRFTPADWRWLRSRTRRDGTIRVGKFNAGQKLNAALTAGAVTVLLGTGMLMYFTGLVRLSWRTGATFVHDWFALGSGPARARPPLLRAQRRRGPPRHAHRAGLQTLGAGRTRRLGRRDRDRARHAGTARQHRQVSAPSGEYRELCPPGLCPTRDAVVTLSAQSGLSTRQDVRLLPGEWGPRESWALPEPSQLTSGGSSP